MAPSVTSLSVETFRAPLHHLHFVSQSSNRHHRQPWASHSLEKSEIAFVYCNYPSCDSHFDDYRSTQEEFYLILSFTFDLLFSVLSIWVWIDLLKEFELSS